jgi:hypothetical protein
MAHMPTISLTEVKSSTLSQDGAEVRVTFATKYAGDYTIAMPAACRDQLVAAIGTTPDSAGLGFEPQLIADMVALNKPGTRQTA